MAARANPWSSWIAIFADLASMPDPASLSAPEAAGLRRRFGALFRAYPELSAVRKERMLSALHVECLRTIPALLDGLECVLPAVPEPGVVRFVGGTSPRFTVQTVESAPFYELIAVLERPPLPFRRCGVCNSIFVRDGKRRFCSIACSDQGISKRRTNSPARRDYMKAYMRKRRSPEKPD